MTTNPKSKSEDAKPSSDRAPREVLESFQDLLNENFSNLSKILEELTESCNSDLEKLEDRLDSIKEKLGDLTKDEQ